MHRELGAGHLNVQQAVDQLDAGEHNPGIVPLTGWDFGVIGTSGDYSEYIFNQASSGYIAVTLVWDRIVEHSGGNTYHDIDVFPNYPYFETINNLDVYLVHKDAIEWSLFESVHASVSFEDNVEHIWFNASPGEYKIIVQHNTTGGPGSSQNYGLAWWFGSGSTELAGDFNGDGSVDAADYVVWRKTDGSSAGYTAWRTNFGSSAGTGTSLVPESSSLLLAAMILCWFRRGIKRR